MDNLVISKLWQDSELINLEIFAVSELVSAKQTCNVASAKLHEACVEIVKYAKEGSKDTFIEFGHKDGNYTPSFSMKYLAPNAPGHMQIEVDLEIEDINDRSHRCRYFIKGELGAVERFGEKLIKLCNANTGTRISLFEIDW